MNERDGKRSRIERREFLKLGGGTLAGAYLLAGCDLLSTQPEKKGGPGTGTGVAGAGRKGKEAPMLAERVKNGELPPVEERLPEDSVVIEPVERVGVYGGEWGSALLGTADVFWLQRTIGYENLVRWDVEWTEVIPNLAESFEANERGTEYTFTLRRGLRWSDGEPFTADDVVFAQNDVYNNTELFPAPLWPGTAEKIDDRAVRFSLSEPNGLFLQQQATGTGSALVTKPFHYLKQFHRKYNKNVDRLVEEAGSDNWVALFDSKAGLTDPALYWQNPDIPTLNPWRISTGIGEGSRVIAERNPYYWKVDPEGSQLPYIDRVVYDVLQDVEVMLTRGLDGNLDMHSRHINTLQNKPVLAENRERGDYDFFDLVSGSMNPALIQLNMTHKNETLRQVFSNKDFRIGLSYAINRQEIIDVVYQQQGEPFQMAPRPEAEELYDEELAKQYTNYDVDLANQFLDRAGYAERDEEGIRLGPDGNPITFAMEYATAIRPEWADVLELVRGYWQAVGIDVSVQARDRSLWLERVEANEHDVIVWQGDQGAYNALAAILEPFYYFPYNSGARYAISWAAWYESDGESGEEPPEPTKEQMRLYDRILATTDRDEQISLMKEIVRIAKEEFYAIGITLDPPGYGIAKNNFHNVPEEMIETATILTPGQTHPEQYFIEN